MLPQDGDNFGASIAINDDGDLFATHGSLGNAQMGGVQIFTRIGDTWTGVVYLGCYAATQKVALDGSGNTLVATDVGDDNFGVYAY